MLYTVTLVSAIWQSESASYLHISSVFCISLPFRSLSVFSKMSQKSKHFLFLSQNSKCFPEHSFWFFWRYRSQSSLIALRGLPRSTRQCRRCKSRGFYPWVWKSPWRRKWQPTSAFRPGKSHGQRVAYSPWGRKGWAPLSK